MPSPAHKKTLPARKAETKSSAPAKNALQTQVISEQRKEIVRLQKLLAKLEVRTHSEIAALKAKLSEEKKTKNIVKVTLLPEDGGLL